MDPFTEPKRSARVASYAVALMLGGAVIVVIGSTATWYELSGATETSSATGTALDVGWLSIGLAVLICAGALLVLRRARRTGGRGWSIAALVLAAFLTLFGFAAAGDPASSYATFEASKIATTEPGVVQAKVEAELRAKIAEGSIVVRAARGAWAVFLGGLLATAGAIIAVAMAGSFRKPATPVSVPTYGEPAATWSHGPPLPPPPQGPRRG